MLNSFNFATEHGVFHRDQKTYFLLDSSQVMAGHSSSFIFFF